MDITLSEKDLQEMLNKILEKSEKWEGGKKFVTKSGIKVRSKIEKIIADFYFDKDIKFKYEVDTKFSKFNDPDSKYVFSCDFYLPDFEIFHEHFGLDQPDYLAKRRFKEDTYKRYKLKFISTTIDDEIDIEEAIVRKLREIGFEIV